MRYHTAGLFLILALAILSAPLAAEAADYGELSRLFAAGEYQNVIKIAEGDLRKDRADITAAYFLGVGYHQLGQEDRSLRFLKEFERLHDQLELRKRKEAGSASGEFTLVDAWYLRAYYLLGEHYVKAGDFARAERHLLRAKSGYDQDHMLNFYLGLTSLELKKYERAHQYFRRMLAIDPAEPSAFYNIAVTYTREGKPREAIEWLGKAIERNPAYRTEAAADKDFIPLKSLPEYQRLISK